MDAISHHLGDPASLGLRGAVDDHARSRELYQPQKREPEQQTFVSACRLASCHPAKERNVLLYTVFPDSVAPRHQPAFISAITPASSSRSTHNTRSGPGSPTRMPGKDCQGPMRCCACNARVVQPRALAHPGDNAERYSHTLSSWFSV